MNGEACGHQGQCHFGDSCWPWPVLTDRSLQARVQGPAAEPSWRRPGRPVRGCPQQPPWEAQPVAQSSERSAQRTDPHKHGKAPGHLARAQNSAGTCLDWVVGSTPLLKEACLLLWPSVPGPAPTRSRESHRWHRCPHRRLQGGGSRPDAPPGCAPCRWPRGRCCSVLSLLGICISRGSKNRW